MFKKILIANRGEIACRIIKTARRLGIETAIVYSEADRDSLAVSLADGGYFIGEAPAASSYLNSAAIIDAAKAFGAQAIHPGYGFLSENPAFANACIAANLVFVGPPVEAMEIMASKQTAKRMLEKTRVPLTPGYHGLQQDDERLLLEAKKIGFPVLLKAAAGGGGKGMRAVYNEIEFLPALIAAKREAMSSFADETMLIEKLISKPRHIEVQIMADNHGNHVHLFERDCSLQRRHQKIIEEAPAVGLSGALRQKLYEASLSVAQLIDYRGAGTIEFLVDEHEHFYFMEMNTRLQVEHPVTEMITGLDLVEWQLRIAANEVLPCCQAEIQALGHAIECRIYAEDPAEHFLPSIGQVRFLKEPTNEGLRIDTGVVQGSKITMYYDPMIAKLSAWGDDRNEALQRLENALSHYHIGGIKTNVPFLQTLLSHPRFTNATVTTDFLEKETITLPAPAPNMGLFMVAAIDYALSWPQEDGILRQTYGWQMHQSSRWHRSYVIAGETFDITFTPRNQHQVLLEADSQTQEVRVHITRDQAHYMDETQSHHVFFEHLEHQFVLYMSSGPLYIERFNGLKSGTLIETGANRLTAPMPATVVAVLKQKGDKIHAGERLMILEAMKMEHTIHAPRDGFLKDVFYGPGAQVKEGAELVTLDTELE